jgi:predicted lactoylglutathione lyase
MDVLNRIEREKEEKNKKEIEEARQKAKEQERINAIMDANKVSVDDFIEEGKARGNTEKLTAEMADEVQSQDEDDKDGATKQEELRRAQEIIARLNHEADEDEEKKEAEIEAARAVAREKFGV